MRSSQPSITDVSARYGAPMGRREARQPPAAPLRLFHVPLNAGGYDVGGAYWGLGAPIYCATDLDNFEVYTRAASRAAAGAHVASLAQSWGLAPLIWARPLRAAS